jgi:hypothetical protein
LPDHAEQSRMMAQPSQARTAPAAASADPLADLLNRRSEAKLAGPAKVLQCRAEATAAATAPPAPVREPGPQPIQPPPNRTGLPDKLKAGVEALSGLSMDDVRVHRNSSEPARLGALAYAQGSDIHLGPGQDRHLPHEAWHVVQQKQGRVRPTIQAKSVAVNDETGLEREADVVGARAAGGAPSSGTLQHVPSPAGIVQRELMLGGEEVQRFGQSQKRLIMAEAATLDTSSEFVPTPEAWEYVDDLVRDPMTHALSARDLASHLVASNLIVPKPKASHSVSVHVSHSLSSSSGRFSGATIKSLPVKPNQEHRRHVIGRHTLARACERSTDSDDQIRGFISRHKGNASGSGRALRNEAYRILQDYRGNLWQGDRGENVAAGFFTGDLYQWFDTLLNKDPPTIEFAFKSLDDISTFGYANKALDDLRTRIKERIKMEFTITDIDTDKVILRFCWELVEFITETARNCELDLPQKDMKNSYAPKVIELFNAFSTRRDIFSSDGIADSFMSTNLWAELRDKDPGPPPMDAD